MKPLNLLALALAIAGCATTETPDKYGCTDLKCRAAAIRAENQKEQERLAREQEQRARQPPPGPDRVALTVPRFPRNMTTQTRGRRTCASVMIVSTDASSGESGWGVALLERELIKSGVSVISSAASGRVEAASKLSPLERSFALAKSSKTDCLFEVLSFKLEEQTVYYVWPAAAPELIEAEVPVFAAAPRGRRWFVKAPQLEVHGKLMAADSGAVLAIVDIWHSAMGMGNNGSRFELGPVGGYIPPGPGGAEGWTWGGEQIAPVREALVGVLAKEIAGAAPAK